MAIDLSPLPVPLHEDKDGVLRVSGTRVTLDTIVGAFKLGATPEGIAQSFPTVPLPDIYIVLGYYLTHLPDVESYLKERERAAQELRAQIEAALGPDDIRARLLARKHS
jgi:uncharacterized protein (DUF433 family)